MKARQDRSADRWQTFRTRLGGSPPLIHSSSVILAAVRELLSARLHKVGHWVVLEILSTVGKRDLHIAMDELDATEQQVATLREALLAEKRKGRQLQSTLQFQMSQSQRLSSSLPSHSGSRRVMSAAATRYVRNRQFNNSWSISKVFSSFCWA